MTAPADANTIAINVQPYTDVLSIMAVDMSTKKVIAAGDIPWAIVDAARSNAKEPKPPFIIRQPA